MSDEKPIRQQILEQGIAITVGDRNKSYGDPVDNLGLAGSLTRLVEKAYDPKVRVIGPAEWNAIQHILIKVGRLITGSAPGRDTYLDGANYFAIAGEAAEREAFRPQINSESHKENTYYSIKPPEPKPGKMFYEGDEVRIKLGTLAGKTGRIAKLRMTDFTNDTIPVDIEGYVYQCPFEYLQKIK